MSPLKEKGREMATTKFPLVLAAAALISLAGCNERPGARVLAKVNGIPLTEADVSYRLTQAHANRPEYGDKSIEDVISQELLYQKGVRLGLDRVPSYRRELDALSRMPPQAKRQEMARRVFNSEIASRIEVSDAEAREYYRKNGERIAGELHLLLARFPAKGQAEEALVKLRGCSDFASVAKEVMTGQGESGRDPWDLGYVSWREIPVDFADDIYRLKPGEVSGILGTRRTGFQIVKLVGVRRVALPRYEDISAELVNRLRDEKLVTAYHHYLAGLKKEATIVTF